MRRYKLERSENGRITQCENADGGNIYAQREQLNKKAMENLERATPGKLGNLSNLQIFNFNITGFATGSADQIRVEYNETNVLPTPLTNGVLFGASNLAGQITGTPKYYNILDVKVTAFNSVGNVLNLLNESFIEFYLAQTVVGGTLNTITKIPQPAPLSSVGGGTTAILSDGAQFGNQSITSSFLSDSVNIPSNTKGLRASGLALKTINMNFASAEVRDDIEINVDVYVDNTSVSTTF
jgi:hypothetical protein